MFREWVTHSDAVLKATSFGDDADTTAAICGQVARAYYGVSTIPERWLKYLFMQDEINAMISKLSKENISFR